MKQSIRTNITLSYVPGQKRGEYLFECYKCKVTWLNSMDIPDRDRCPICKKWRTPKKHPFQKVMSRMALQYT